MPKSSARGASTSGDVEILALTPHALWLHVRGREYMLDYTQFPWFRSATIEEVQRVVLHHEHLSWPSLDVDLHLDSLDHPERFPLVSKKGRRATRPKRR